MANTVRQLDLQLSKHLVPIATKAVSLISVERCTQNNQPYVKKFVSDLKQIHRFLFVLRFPAPIKLIPMM